MCFYKFRLCTRLLIGTWMREWWFVLYQPQWLIVCTGSSMGWGQDPCMPWIHQWCVARRLRKTQYGFSVVVYFPWPRHDMERFSSRVQSPLSTEVPDMWLQNQDEMHMIGGDSLVSAWIRASEDWLANVKRTSCRGTFVHNSRAISLRRHLTSSLVVLPNKPTRTFEWLSHQRRSYFLGAFLFVIVGLLIFLGLHIYIISE